ncbi:MAG: UDP-N-acetylglucosamine 2-epimerase (non-hydrolyzing) [Candidatus Omnitrophica bacterium]|nr:UDP-N-acetylglucosamine 2-epimerase (non-hydrolyzing) [Candidatus Omnitrophota bacterium]
MKNCKRFKILSVVGARPNFIKIAPFCSAIKSHKNIDHCLVHTGQHYDAQMSDSFFKDLEIPTPDFNLNVGSASHAVQTAKIMIEFEKVLKKAQPNVVVVVGDVNSTLACSLVASKMGFPVAHIEAGLRSFDRTMPEEINRILTDSISDILFTSCTDANRNLLKEGLPKNRIFFVGNIMIDSLRANQAKANKQRVLELLGLKKGGFCLVTLHRPSNVDNLNILIEIFSALEVIQRHLKVIFPVHPRTQININKLIKTGKIKKSDNLLLIKPLSYLSFFNILQRAKFVITDSGGIQEETTVLGIPCLTVRTNTERPITEEIGTNILVGSDKKALIKESLKVLTGKGKKGTIPKYWDGNTAKRIIKILIRLHTQNILFRYPKSQS